MSDTITLDQLRELYPIINHEYSKYVGPLSAQFLPQRRAGDPPLPILYHYSDVNALKGVIENHSIWATNCGYMNDRSEVLYGTEALSGALIASQSVILNQKMPIDQQIFDNLILSLQEHNGFRCYAACLSFNGDQLSQWRGYGCFGSGYSIGFDALSLTHDFSTIAEPIELSYDPKSLQNTAATFVSYLTNVLQSIPEHLKIVGADVIRQFLELHITSYAIRYKHYKFEEEREFRFAVSESPDDPIPLDDIKLRTSNNLVVPYLTLGKGSHEILPIREIIIGPRLDHEKAEYSVRKLLQQNGYDLSTITIKPSEIPFV
ncbi:MAG: DUF2971 domain-containing protein [Capsulimonas sp.]|uniref:DUF2971 domain-containing protein n=1 Tax=Capsulimonas sp. TaxID=2494211 RepID=UPI003265E2D6